MDVQLPNGQVIKGVPDGTTKAQLSARLKANGIETGIPDAPAEKKPAMYGRGQLPIPDSKQGLVSPKDFQNAADVAAIIPAGRVAGLAEKGLSKLVPGAAERMSGKIGKGILSGEAGGATYNAATGKNPLTGAIAGGTIGAAAPVVGKVAGAVGERFKPPEERANTYIAKTLMKSGQPVDTALANMQRARGTGLTAGESSKNPELLGMERKIAGMNRPGGETVRGFAADRVNPNNTGSLQYKLGEKADYLKARLDKASKKIGSIVQKAGNESVNVSSITKPLSQHDIVPGSPESATVQRIQGLADWAKSKGNTFAAWHRVKQEIGNLRSEAKNPTAAQKIDMRTVDTYYNKVNDVLSGRKAGLPPALKDTGKQYGFANEQYAQSLSGGTIRSILDKVPTKGTPTEKLNFLYKNLAGNAETQKEVLSGMPASERQEMMSLLRSINAAARSGLNDVTKINETSAAGMPLSKSGAFNRLTNWVMDAITRKDYDALGRALTNPDILYVSKNILKKASPARAGAASVEDVGRQVPWNLPAEDSAKIDGFIKAEKLKRLPPPSNQLVP